MQRHAAALALAALVCVALAGGVSAAHLRTLRASRLAHSRETPAASPPNASGKNSALVEEHIQSKTEQQQQEQHQQERATAQANEAKQEAHDDIQLGKKGAAQKQEQDQQHSTKQSENQAQGSRLRVRTQQLPTEFDPSSAAFDPDMFYRRHSYMAPYNNYPSIDAGPQMQYEPAMRSVVDNVNELVQHWRPFVDEKKQKEKSQKEMEAKRLEQQRKAELAEQEQKAKEQNAKESKQKGAEEQLRKERNNLIVEFQAGAGHEGVCTSWGDTHMITFENRGFNIWRTHTFILSKADNFELQAQQRVWHEGNPPTVDKAFAHRCGQHIMEAKMTGQGDRAFEIRIDQKSITPPVGQEQLVPSDEWQLHYTFKSGPPHTSLAIDCRPKLPEGGTKLEPGIAIQIDCDQTRQDGYCNVNLHVDKEYQGKLEGACGWLSPKDNHPRYPDELPCNEATQCSLYDVGPGPGNLFDPAAQAAMSGYPPSVQISDLDEAKLAPEVQHCQTLLDAVLTAQLQTDIANADDLIAKDLQTMRDDCAVDGYYGLRYQQSDMNSEVCGWVSKKIDAVNEEGGDPKIVQLLKQARC